MSVVLCPVTFCTNSSGTPAVIASGTQVTRKPWKSPTLASRPPPASFSSFPPCENPCPIKDQKSKISMSRTLKELETNLKGPKLSKSLISKPSYTRFFLQGESTANI